jgi:diguanylate cyclase (GGDEF)-like protein
MAAPPGGNEEDGTTPSETPGQTSEDRDRIGHDRDETSGDRDDQAGDRDDKAGDRDHRAEARDTAVRAVAAGSASDRALALEAASDREEALRDRQEAARDRAHAATDRQAASLDRSKAAGERVASSIDGLTGAHRRDAGILELERERARAQRTAQPFVVVFVDVDGLKATNDSRGHAAGDELLRQVVDTIRSRIRSYDLIVRFGGDEFVCGILDLNMEEALERFSLVNADLARIQHASVTVGLAELKEDDSLDDLIGRADQAMYIKRQQQRRALPRS